jgi:hypothetical protein
MTQPPETTLSDLAGSLPGHAEFLTYLVQGVRAVAFQTEAQAQDPGLARGESGQHPIQVLT